MWALDIGTTVSARSSYFQGDTIPPGDLSGAVFSFSEYIAGEPDEENNLMYLHFGAIFLISLSRAGPQGVVLLF